MILVGITMHDRRLDLAADPAVRPDRDAAPQVGAEKLRVGADRARAFDPSERLHPDVRPQHDRTVHRVENRVGIDPRGLVNPEPIDGAHQGQLRQVPVAHARPCPPPRNRGADGRHSSRPGPTGDRSTRRRLRGRRAWTSSARTTSRRPAARATTASSGPTHASAGCPSHRPTHGPNTIGQLESDRRHPAAVGHDHRPRASQSRSLTTMCGTRCRCTSTRCDRIRQLRRCGPGPTPSARDILLSSVVAPKQQFMDWPSQRQGLEPTSGMIFHQAQTHDPSVLQINWSADPRRRLVDSSRDSVDQKVERRHRPPRGSEA